VNAYALCGLCREPVLVGQGRWHLSCLGPCRNCYERPAAHADSVECQQCIAKRHAPEPGQHSLSMPKVESQ
jgi:hypothetical protein